MSTTAAAATREVIERHDAFMSINYPRFDVVMARGGGSRLWDADGAEYLDLFAGFGASVLGHCHPELVEAVNQQATQLWHVGNLLHTEPQTIAAELISRLGFGGRSFFCHAGADANEAAIKLARLYGKANPGQSTDPVNKRYRIICTTKSFHGRSLATIAATGNDAVRTGFEPIMPGFVHVGYNDIDAVKAEIDADTVAIIAEPIQGEGGVNVPDVDYFAQLRRLCDEHELLLIADEVWTGGARTGKVFGHQLWNIEPDIMTLGKGIGGGLPVGVMCAKPHVASLYDAREHGVKHASTLGGNCLSMAVCARIFQIIERDSLADRAATLGTQAMAKIDRWRQSLPFIKAVRGSGLFIGVELDASHSSAWFEKAGDVVKRCLERGLIVGSAGVAVIRLAPAITIDEDDLNRGLDQLFDVLKGS